MVEHLPDDSKKELVKALKEVAARSRRYCRCLAVQIDGFGRFDPQATRSAAEQYRRAIEIAAEITSDEVAPAGLFLPQEERAR
jgi:hypothetical protein